jgi:hypothetical protein
MPGDLDCGAMADSDTHDVDEDRQVRFRDCLQHGQGAFNFCGPWRGRA